jgi:hypothetical protein
MLLCVSDIVEGRLCLLEVPEVPEVMCCVLVKGKKVDSICWRRCRC